MKFYEIVEQAATLLRKSGRLSYRGLQMEFDLDDDELQAIREELIFCYPQIDEVDSRGLCWTDSRQLQSTPAQPDTDAQPLPDRSFKIAERRQLTIMFCDLVGSTALSRMLDPEDLRQLMQLYQRTAAQIVARFDGHIA